METFSMSRKEVPRAGLLKAARAGGAWLYSGGGGAIRRPVPVRLGGAGTSEKGAFMSLTLRRRGRKASTRSAFPAREGLEIDRRIHDTVIALAEGNGGA
jgi:hypothetical protein